MIMRNRTGRWLMLASIVSPMAMVPTAPAGAQDWRRGSSCRGLEGGDRDRCERASDRRDDRWDRRRDRERRKDAKTDGIVVGVVGTAILGGIIAAAASGKNKKRDGNDDRRAYCERRYGNYDERTDSYRASDGRWYRCE
jgi:hypothetical protein